MKQIAIKCQWHLCKVKIVMRKWKIKKVFQIFLGLDNWMKKDSENESHSTLVMTRTFVFNFLILRFLRLIVDVSVVALSEQVENRCVMRGEVGETKLWLLLGSHEDISSYSRVKMVRKSFI